jgi:dipeptidyl aminopeptidase/acylaminoacyl peptidase
LIAGGLVASDKAFIEGASAGGYTALCALAFGKVFAAGASHYGISDLSLLTEETHKFESHYMDQLIGPYPEYKTVYEARSPIMNKELLNRPVILFQGEEDQVVPPNQAKEFYDILIARGIQAELVLYPGEQHGFRKAETIRDVLEKELIFYQLII